MPIELYYEQKEAYNKVLDAIEYSGHRSPVFIYGKEGVGRTKIMEKVKENYDNDSFSLISVRKLIINKYKEIPQPEIPKKFLMKYDPKDFLNKLMNKYLDKQILVLDDIEFLISNKTLEKLNINKDFLFGKYSDFIMNGRLMWIFSEVDFISFQDYWELKDSPLKQCRAIEVKPPSLKSLKAFYEKNRNSEEFEISDEELKVCLEEKYYLTLRKKIKRKKR